MIADALANLIESKDISFKDSSEVMTEIMEGEATSAQVGGFLTALRMKGETAEEVAGMATVMKSKSLKLEISQDVVDTCGTGGDGLSTFNISTASAFVVAGAGVKVAKHGNRAMSSKTGSADVLESLGININMSPPEIVECINQTGFGFMFAQGFHPAMKHAAGPRRELAIPTVFNILGPLTNPANAKRQVIGASDGSKGKLMAQVLVKLGSIKAVVVHGDDGLDEATVSGESTIWIVNSGSVEERKISPTEFGIPVSKLDSLRVSDSDESATMINDVLRGGKGPARDVVLINSALALYVASDSDDIQKFIEISRESLDSGSALSVLERYKDFSNSCVPND